VVGTPAAHGASVIILCQVMKRAQFAIGVEEVQVKDALIVPEIVRIAPGAISLTIHLASLPHTTTPGRNVLIVAVQFTGSFAKLPLRGTCRSSLRSLASHC